jgi:hypothetical protein
MKTTSSSYKTAQLDDLKSVIPEAGDPQTPITGPTCVLVAVGSLK